MGRQARWLLQGLTPSSPPTDCAQVPWGGAQASRASGVILGPVMRVAPGASLPAQALGDAAPFPSALPR